MVNTIGLDDASVRFTDYLKKQQKATATIIAYQNDLTQLCTFLKEKGLTVVNSTTPSLLEDFKNYLLNNGYTPKSTSRKINSIKTFFKFLKSEGLIESDPAANIAHPKFQVKPPRILTKTEYRALRDACHSDIRIYAIVELMLQTGMRIGEVAHLRLEDLKSNEVYVRPFESHEDRTIPLNKAAKEALDRYLKIRKETKEKVVFVTKTGRPFLIRNIRSSIERYFEIAGIKNAKVNDLRHTWIYHHLAEGTPLVLISKLAGHKRVSTTEKYLNYIGQSGETSVRLEEL